MDTSYLAQQVTTIIGQLHGLFDEIGVPSHERDTREAELFSALSETLHGQLRSVTNEKHEMTEEAHRLIKNIRDMEASLGSSRRPNSNSSNGDDVEVTYPLTRCLQALKEKHSKISKLHRERYEQVRKLAEALESYASHLEQSFVQIKLPPTSPNAPVSPSFDISPAYVSSLDAEFTRVYEEYTRRVNVVRILCQEIIQLWAELGTPQAQTDSSIVKYHRDAPEQLGLHPEDMAELKAKKERLLEEKRGRERRLAQLRSTIEDLWERLGVEEHERKQFLHSNRGCGLRTINEYEDELARLNELKRQNLHLFVEEARIKLQELWDSLFFSEEEMLDFAPAFSDVCTDALLSAHEQEIARLEALKVQRLPILQKIDRHRELVKERDDLQASSQDASRLMARGNKGERRDPGKLLREEKMRKRIAKELPKVESDLIKTLEQWEDEYGRPFLVLGERYLDELNATAAKVPPPRSKTPSVAAPAPKQAPKSLTRTRSHTSHGSAMYGNAAFSGPPPSRSKTPTANFGASIRGNPFANSVMSSASAAKSPTKIPARAPLKNMPHGGNSPERRSHQLERSNSTISIKREQLERSNSTIRRMGPPRVPPPKMKDLFIPPEPVSTPANDFEYNRERSGSIVRHVSPEDPYSDNSYSSLGRTMTAAYAARHAPPVASSRQLSQTSQTSSTGTGNTTQSCSENWETFSEHSEPERDVDFNAYRHAAMAPHKRFTPDGGQSPQKIQGKKIRSIRGVGGSFMAEGDSVIRVVEGSEAGWTDEEAF